MCNTDSKARGALIVLEGIDRSGKTTQSAKLLEWFTKEEGRNARIQRFPDRDEASTGKAIDDYLRKATKIEESREAIHLLFAANRWALAQRMREDLCRGVSLIVDRYSFSGVTYSMAKGLEKTWLCYPEIGLPRPDIVLFFDVPPEQTSERSGFGDEIMERSEFQEKVYKNIYDVFNDKYWKKINAADTIENVHAKVISEVKPILASLTKNEVESMDLSDFGIHL